MARPARARRRRTLLEAELAGGELLELRIGVENRPGTVAEIALALGQRRRQHRGHGALSGRRHAHRRDLACGSPAPTGASARGEVVARPRPRRRRRRLTRGDAASSPRAAARRAHAAARQVDLAPGGDVRRDGRGRRRAISGYLDAADTRSTLEAVAALGADVDVTRARAPGRSMSRSAASACAARPPPASIDVGNAGTLMRLMPGWLAGQDGGEWTLDGDESIRRRPMDRIAEPLRAMGAEDRVPRGAAAAADGRAAPGCTGSTTSCRSPAPR